MKKSIAFCGLLAVSLNLFAESVYTYDVTKDLIIGSAALGLSLAPLFITRAADNASANADLQKGMVNAFDRNMMYPYDKAADLFGDISVYGIILMPLAALWGNARDANAWTAYGIMYAQALLLVFGTTETMKNAIMRYRPYNYFGDIPSGKESDYFKSFPSRHTAFAFMSAGFLTAAFCTEYPDSRLKIPVSAAAYSLAAGIGISRIFSGSHFLTDTLTGAAIGSLVGYTIPWLHLRKNRNGPAVSPLPNGFLIAWQF